MIDHLDRGFDTHTPPPFNNRSKNMSDIKRSSELLSDFIDKQRLYKTEKNPEKKVEFLRQMKEAETRLEKHDKKVGITQ